MRFVFTSYVRSPEFDRPESWIKRIQAYLGVLESLAKQHDVISIEQINYQGDYQQNGVQYHFMDFHKRKLYFPFRLHRFIKKQKPDIILVHGMGFSLQVIQLRLAMGSQVKIIVQNHESKPAGGYKKILQRWADKYIDAYFFTSKQMSTQWLQEGLITNEKKIHEVMVGSSVFKPVNKQEARLKINCHDAPVFLWAGRLDANKDPLTVVKAFLRFTILQPAARLYMIYQTDELKNELNSLIDKTGTKENIILVGKVSHEDMLYWFSSADFFISGSHFEVFGAAVSEAMSCGCVPIVTAIPSFQKITGEGSCGLLYTVGDENALYDSLRKTLSMDLEKEQEKITVHFTQHLSFDAIAQKIQELAASL